jgi:hypothetical protein
VTLVTTPFRVLAEKRWQSLGVDDLPILFFPHPLATRSNDDIERLADSMLPEVRRMLLAKAGG